MGETRVSDGFPTLAGVLFGLGLGGFFDGVVLHQLLQWHHMLSNWYPIVDLPSLELNTVWDGIFHSSTFVFVVIGLLILWRTAHRRHLLWSNKLLVGTLLLGWGLFNTVEGSDDARRRVAGTASRKARDEGRGMTIIARVSLWFVLGDLLPQGLLPTTPPPHRFADLVWVFLDRHNNAVNQLLGRLGRLIARTHC